MKKDDEEPPMVMEDLGSGASTPECAAPASLYMRSGAAEAINVVRSDLDLTPLDVTPFVLVPKNAHSDGVPPTPQQLDALAKIIVKQEAPFAVVALPRQVLAGLVSAAVVGQSLLGILRNDIESGVSPEDFAATFRRIYAAAQESAKTVKP